MGIPESPQRLAARTLLDIPPVLCVSVFGRIPDVGRTVASGLDRPGAEFFLPAVVNRLVHEHAVDVDVLSTPCSWFGMTYPADKPTVTAHIRSRVEMGEYPSDLIADLIAQ